MSTLSDQILDLKSQGLTYNEISAKLGCSKGLISYYLNPGGKTKSLDRQRKNRSKNHPYTKKLEHFLHKKAKPKNNKVKNTIRYIYRHLLESFFMDRKTKTYQKPTFTVEDIIAKLGENPVCYLTGEELDINNPRSFAFDHIIPASRGGTNTLDNLGICNKTANRSKTDLTPDEYLNLCKKVLEHNGYQVSKPSQRESNPPRIA